MSGFEEVKPIEGNEAEVFAKLSELDEKESLTAEDVEWFKSGAIESAFRSRGESSDQGDGQGNEEIDTGDVIESNRSNELELLHQRVTIKVEKLELANDNVEK